MANGGGAIAQQALQRGAVVCFDAHASVHRKPAVLVGQHLFGLETPQQTRAHEGTQIASAQGGRHLGHSIRINADAWVEDHVCL